jgi:hypothetical protein
MAFQDILGMKRNLLSGEKRDKLLCLVGVFVVIALTAAIVYGPGFLIVSPDLESFFSTIYSTMAQARSLKQGSVNLWTTLLGLGMPQPFASTLSFHPIILLLQFIPMKICLVLFYWLQMTTGSCFVYATARHVKLSVFASLCCAITYLLCAPNLNYALVDFWPEVFHVWTSLPILFYCILAVFDADASLKSFSSACLLALFAALAMLNGHNGVVATYGIMLAVFILALRPTLPQATWLAVAGLGFGLAVGFRVFTLYSEMSAFPPSIKRLYVPYSLLSLREFWALFLKPLVLWGKESFLPFNLQVGVRNFWFGPIFLLLAILGMWKGKISPRNRWAFTVVFLGGILLAHLPESLCGGVIAWLIAFRDPAILAAIFLAGAAIDHLGGLGRTWRRGVIGLVAGHFLLMAGGASPFWLQNFSSALVYAGKKPLSFMPAAKQVTASILDVSPLIEKLRALYAHSPGRFAFAADIGGKHGFPYDLIRLGFWHNTLGFHGLPIIDGYFKGVYVPLYPTTDMLMHSQIVADRSLADNTPLLDLLGVRYILALATEIPPPGTRLVLTCPSQEKSTLLVYENPGAWPFAVFVAADTLDLKLPPVPGCSHDRLLCADAGPVLSRKQGDTRATLLEDGVAARFDPSEATRWLLVSQMYRPGWRAVGKNRQGERTALPTREALDALVAVEIPPGIVSVDIRYRPQRRLWLAYLSWGMLGLLTVIPLAITILRWTERHRSGKASA